MRSKKNKAFYRVGGVERSLKQCLSSTIHEMFIKQFQSLPKMLSGLIWLLVMGTVAAAVPDSVDLDLSVDKTNWVDPLDPLAKPSQPHLAKAPPPTTTEGQCFGEEHANHYIEENERLRQALEALEALRKERDDSVDVLLKHILRRFLLRLNIPSDSTTDFYKKADVVLTVDNLRVINRYLGSQKASEEFGLREHVRFALEDFLTEADVRSESSLFSMLHKLLPYIILLNLCILPPAVLIVFRSVFTVRQLLLVVLVGSFFLSCYFTYARKYQEILAQRFERMELKSKEGTCTPKGLMSEALNVMLSYVRIKGKSECLQSFEDMLIEPIWLVDPMQVVAEVLSNFFLSPLSVAGHHLNKFFNDFFINTPIHLAVLKTLFLVFLLFYLTGYRLRTLFATIEPAESIVRYIPHLLMDEQHQPQQLQPQLHHTAQSMLIITPPPPECPSQSRSRLPPSTPTTSTDVNFDDSNVTKRRTARKSPRKSQSSSGEWSDIESE